MSHENRPGAPFRIDTHHHFMLPEFTKAVFSATKLREKIDLVRAVGVTNLRDQASRLDRDWTVEKTLAWMDRHEVATVIGSLPATVYLDDKRFLKDLARQCNERFAEIIREHPDRFGGFAMIPLPDVSAAVDEVEYSLDVLELDGVVLVASTGGVYLGAPEHDPLFAALDRRHAVVFIHPFVLPSRSRPLANLHVPPYLIEYVIETTRTVTSLLYSETLEKYPNIRFILSHAGGTVPYIAERISLGQEMPGLAGRVPQGVETYLRRMYYDTALSANATTFAALQRVAAPERIVFGSDYPAAPEEMTVHSIAGLDTRIDLTPTERRAIYRDNALQLFPRLRDHQV